MKVNNRTSEKGMTLLEIILAIAILAIIIIAVLNLFSFSLSSIFYAGDKTQTVGELEGIVTEIMDYANTSPFSSQGEVEAYLSGAPLNYNQKTSATVMDKDPGEDMNFYVGAEETLNGTTTVGYSVTLFKFHSGDKRSTKVTFFVIKGGF